MHLFVWMFLLSCCSSEVDLKIVFTSPDRVKSFLNFKDKLLKMLLAELAYKYKCGGCSIPYYSKTKRYFKARICKHFGISHLVGKKVKIKTNKTNNPITNNPITPIMLQ